MNSRMRFLLGCALLAVLLAIVLDSRASAQAMTESVGASGISLSAKPVFQSVTPSAPQSSGQRMSPQAPTPATPATASDQNITTQEVSDQSAPLRVRVGKSLLINTADRLRRVSVTDPAVADALVVTPTQVLVHGRAPGEVTLLMWNESEQSRSFDLRVDVDATAAGEEMRRIFPGQKIEVSSSRSSLVLSGHVATKEDAERAGLIASAYTKNVVNVMTFGPVGAQEVLLEVKFAEVNRTALMQLGLNLFSTGAANTFGTTSTQQFGSFSGSKVGSLPADINGSTSVTGNHAAAGAIGNTLQHQPGVFGMTDLLNIMLFRSDINLGVIVKALQQKNILQILAEPNLIALNGKEASFLAGGEFPFPVVQAGTGTSSISIMFKEFGVRLKFIPLITPEGSIHLQVMPEVSALDFTNALQISGFFIPALSTRRATTELELQDGQSFVIAGLLDNRVTNIASKIPGLGDIPILGTLFKSKNIQKSKTELMVLVTARRVSPTTAPPPLPHNPLPYMDQKPGDKSADKATAGGAQ
ncbi:MAG TPA: pilus assembly protein N-terminal domain-containing protein [Clostridia bacterium]|nr:pilus assembly protein N-terminal domain-containing protein [Clostridia bacterium]